MERKADLFPNASTKGRQWTPCHKDCLLSLNTAIRFYRPARRGRTKGGEAGQATPGKRHAKTPPKSHSPKSTEYIVNSHKVWWEGREAKQRKIFKKPQTKLHC